MNFRQPGRETKDFKSPAQEIHTQPNGKLHGGSQTMPSFSHPIFRLTCLFCILIEIYFEI
jgi:hypothetical protein